MASEEDNSKKTYREQCRNRLKTVGSFAVEPKRPKASTEKKRLQHPESFPLPKKLTTKQVSVDSFRVSSFDTKHLKDSDVRSPLTTAFSSISEKSNEKLFKCKSPLSHLRNDSPSLLHYPNKFMMEVPTTKNKEGKIKTGSHINSPDICFPNFILCCTSKTILKEGDRQPRIGEDGRSSVRSSLPSLSSIRKINMENSHLQECSAESKVCSGQENSKEIFLKVSSATHKSELSPNSKIEPSEPNSQGLKLFKGSKQIDRDISDDATNSYRPERRTDDCLKVESTNSVANLKMITRCSKTEERRMNPSSQSVDVAEISRDADQQFIKLEDGICECPETNVECLRNGVKKTTSNLTEISASDCGDSSDDLVELKNYNRGIQEDKTLRIYRNNNDHNTRATCRCCIQEEIRTGEDVIPTKSNFNEWLQMQHANANAVFQYPFCCPEDGGFCGCCCAGTPMPPLPSYLISPNSAAMPSIPPSSPLLPPQAFVSPERFERNSYRGPMDKTVSHVSTEFGSLNEASEILRQENKRYSSGSEKRTSIQVAMGRAQSTRSRHNTGFPGRQESYFKTSWSEGDLLSSSNGQSLRNKRATNRESKKQTEIPQHVTTPEQWCLNRGNNFLNGYVPNNFYGCGVCPPYQGPWCFPWWYSPYPPGFDQCYNTMPGTSNVYSPNSNIFNTNPLPK